MAIRDDFFTALTKGAKWDVGVSINRTNPLPLDQYSVFESEDKLDAYIAGAFAYPGQIVAVIGENETTIYYLDQNKAKQLVGIVPTGDGKTISVTKDGQISLLVANVEAGEGAQLTLQKDGTLKWVKPDTTTISGLQTAVGELQTKVDELETDLAEEVERATGAEEALDIAVKAAQKTADEAKTAITNFLTSEEIDDTVNTLKEIQAEIDKMTDATELTTAIAGKADKTYVDDELAKKQNVIAENTYDAYGSAATAKSEAIAAAAQDATTKANTAKEAAIADADAKFQAIKDHETIDSFADVVAELNKKQDKLTEGAYATETYVDNKVKALADGAVATAQNTANTAKSAAEAAQRTADEAKASAIANAANISTINTEINGEGGLVSRITSAEGRISTLEGTVAEHTTAISENATAAANAQAQADEALRVANTKTTIAEVEAKGYAVAETVNAEIAKKTTMAEVEAKGYAVAETVNGELAKKADKETIYTKTEVDGLVAPLATTEALNGVKATAEQGVADAAAAKGVADAAKARIDAFIDGTAEAESAIDTLVEIQQYMTADTEAFTQLSNKVTNIENGTTTVPKATDADTVDGKHASDFEVAGAAADALAEAKEYADAIDTGVMKVESLTDLLIVTTDENGNVKIALPDEIIFNGGGANI